MRFEGNEKSDSMLPQGINLEKLLDETESLLNRLISPPPQSITFERLLEERERLDELIKDQFTREITVMYTDFEGFTSIVDAEGDVESRMLIKKHNDIVFPVIEAHHGVLVKTMGDGTLSYFEEPSDAVRAAVRIQKDIAAYNLSDKRGTSPIALRIGMNTGVGIVEERDIFGDVVNVASRFESLAGPGEIFMSGETFDALGDRDGFCCRHTQTISLFGKKEPYEVYKVYWNEREIEKERLLSGYTGHEPGGPSPESTPESAPIDTGRLPERETAARKSAVEMSQGSNKIQNARRLKKENELIALYLYCEAFLKLQGVADIYHALTSDLHRNGKVETRLGGKKAVWFFREAITLGRSSGADFPMTDEAFARVCITVGIRDGEGVLKIKRNGIDKLLHTIELRRGSNTEKVMPDIEYLLGREGKIVCAGCFPIEFCSYKRRFLTLNVPDPEQLKSERILVIGT